MANALIQKIAASFGNSASARTLQYANNVTSGSLLTCWVPIQGTGVTVTVSDYVNGNWTQAGTDVVNGTIRGGWWYFVNSAGGSKPTVTVTPSSTATVTIMLHEHSVTSPTGVTLDNSSQNTGATSAQNTGSCPVAGAGELVLAGGSSNNTTITSVSGGGFVLEQTISVNHFGETADDVNASSAETCTFAPNKPNSWAAMAISFKMPAAGGGFLLSRRRKVIVSA